MIERVKESELISEKSLLIGIFVILIIAVTGVFYVPMQTVPILGFTGAINTFLLKMMQDARLGRDQARRDEVKRLMDIETARLAKEAREAAIRGAEVTAEAARKADEAAQQAERRSHELSIVQNEIKEVGETNHTFLNHDRGVILEDLAVALEEIAEKTKDLKAKEKADRARKNSQDHKAQQLLVDKQNKSTKVPALL